MKTFSMLNKSWRNERLGLTMIAGSLLVILSIALLTFHYQKLSATKDIRTQGLSLVRLVAEIPYDQLQSQRATNTLNIIYHSQKESALAYIALSGQQGEPLSEIAAPGIILPAAGVLLQPTDWIGERELVLSDDRSIMEFHAPLLVNSKLKGFVRLGYFKPGLHFDFSQLSFLASLALPIFLLTPLFYGLLRREIRPLSQANRQIINQMDEFKPVSFLTATGELAEFMQNFNQYMQTSKTTINRLEDERSTMIASTSIDAYKSAKIEAILHSVPDAIMVFDKSGSIILVNNKVSAIFSSSDETILSEPLKNWCKDNEIFSYISKIQHSGALSRPPETIKVLHDNTSKSLSMATFPVYSVKDNKEIIGTTLIIQDRTQESLAEVNREEFVAHISHELKTPLNSLLTYSEALLGPEGEDAAFRVEGLNVIFDETERMRDLINNLLNITKIESGSLAIERQRVKLNEFLRDALDNVRTGMRSSNLKFVVNLDHEVSDVAVDKGLLRVAINNLLTNAIKYNRDDGTVSLELEELDNTIYIKVRDTGIGISEEDQRRIFDKFYRSETDETRQRSGHGLGLALARDIVQLHNGQLTVNSVLGQGTEFIIELQKETDLLRQIG